MGGTVLRGDWIRVRRRGDRVWIRFRPYELLWHTAHSFTVGDVHSIEIEPVRRERRRHGVALRPGAARASARAITRVTFEYGIGHRASVDLNETEATVVATFEDLVAGGELAAPAPIHWRADPERSQDDLDGEQCTLWDDDDRLSPELAQDVSFKLELGADPHDVRRWVLHQLHEAPAHTRSAPSAVDEWFDVQELPAAASVPGSAVWVRKRRRRARHLLRRRSA
jgi:hypothetical protein